MTLKKLNSLLVLTQNIKTMFGPQPIPVGVK